MARKYEIYHEVGWDESTNQPTYEKLTTIKNEQAAINFVNDVDNVGKYGSMRLYSKADGELWIYNEHTGEWAIE